MRRMNNVVQVGKYVFHGYLGKIQYNEDMHIWGQNWNE